MPEEEYKGLIKDINLVMDDISEETTKATPGNLTKLWNDHIKPLNVEIRKYNLAISEMKDTDNIEMLMYQYWPEDFLHNIIKAERKVLN
jgi:hypothetical protein